MRGAVEHAVPHAGVHRAGDGGPVHRPQQARVGSGPFQAAGQDVEAALAVDPDEWRAELPKITDWFTRFGDKLPAVLWSELESLSARLTP